FQGQPLDQHPRFVFALGLPQVECQESQRSLDSNADTARGEAIPEIALPLACAQVKLYLPAKTNGLVADDDALPEQPGRGAKCSACVRHQTILRPCCCRPRRENSITVAGYTTTRTFVACMIPPLWRASPVQRRVTPVRQLASPP